MSFVGSIIAWMFTIPIAYSFPSNTVSTSSNPIFAYGGETTASSTSTLATAPADQKMIITDVVITMVGRASGRDPCTNRVSIQTGAGNIAEFVLASDTYYGDYYMRPTQVSHSYRSGLPIAPSDSFGITNHGSYCTISFSLSGYYATP